MFANKPKSVCEPRAGRVNCFHPGIPLLGSRLAEGTFLIQSTASKPIVCGHISHRQFQAKTEAVRLFEYGGPDKLILGEYDLPALGERDVLV